MSTHGFLVRNKLIRGAIFCAGFAAWGCFFESESKPSPKPPLDGMRSIAADKRVFQLGSTSPMAAPDEKPVLRGTFAHDFMMDTVEVTQLFFRQIMGRDPVPASSPFGKGDDYPVFNVTWYDAALFCNRRSQLQGLDTVYAYRAIKRAADGGVYGLENLVAHLDRDGFRLPTEAEWEFSAAAGGEGVFPWGGLADTGEAAKHAWYLGNSGGRSHPVATLRPNGFGLYDMAGNVMEWVNDWKVEYPISEVREFAGAREPGLQREIPVKGGGFNFGIREMRIANRSATYPAIPSSSTEYVGFRCVRGAIANPGYVSSESQLLETDPPDLDITRLSGYLGGRPAKLAFVNVTSKQRNLVYVDYATRTPVFREYTDSVPVFYPNISPDGRWVAFGTASEGVVSGSSIYVRDLTGTAGSRRVAAGFIPRWWVDPLHGDTLLIYANSAADDVGPLWQETQTLAQKMSGGNPVGSPEILTAAGGFHDGRSSGGRYLATGYRRLKIHDFSDGSTRTLFTAPQNGKAAGDTSQVCNVSMAPDSSGRTLFLDFGYSAKSALTGGLYDVHQIAFMARPDGSIERWYRQPSEMASWDEMEWSNHPDYAVAGGTEASGKRGSLYLVNLKDSLYLRIASGTWLTQPALWVGDVPAVLVDPTIASDSAGWYNEPAGNVYQANFSGKMARYWPIRNDAETAFFGSSHVEGGIYPDSIKSMRAFNFGISDCNWQCSETLARNYVLKHSPKLKVMVMEALLGWMIKPLENQDAPPSMFFNRGFQYDRNHGFWGDGLPTGFETLVKAAPNFQGFDAAGGYHAPAGDWGANPPATGMRNDWGVEDSRYRDTFERMKALALEAAARKIHFVLVNYPESPAYKSNAFYQRYGPAWPAARAIIAQLRGLESLSPYIHFYDAHDFGDHDYAADEAQNWDHLSYRGALKLTGRIDSLIARFR